MITKPEMEVQLSPDKVCTLNTPYGLYNIQCMCCNKSKIVKSVGKNMPVRVTA